MCMNGIIVSYSLRLNHENVVQIYLQVIGICRYRFSTRMSKTFNFSFAVTGRLVYFYTRRISQHIPYHQIKVNIRKRAQFPIF